MRTSALLIFSLVLSACAGSNGPSSSSVPAKRAAETVPPFVEGCLAPLPNLKTAFSAFERHGVSYHKPWSFGGAPTGRRIFSAGYYLAYDDRFRFEDRRNSNAIAAYDAPMLGCTIRRVGSFGSEAHAAIVNGLKQQGFRTLEPLARPADRSQRNSTGLYVRDGIRYEVWIAQSIPATPPVSHNSKVRYIRDNRWTSISIVKETLPRGAWR